MPVQQKYALLLSLYLAQGLPYGFITQALPVLLREYDVSLKAIGLTSLLFIPWALKFLWAPLLDKYFSPRWGRRRSWILPLLAATALMLIFTAQIDPATQLYALLACVLVINFLAATQDVATDGLAVELLEPAQRGIGNGIQVAGYRAGMVIGGGALLMISDQIGWNGSFLIMAALILLSTLPIGFYKEPKHQKAASQRPAADRSLIASFLNSPGVWAWLGLLLLYKLGDGISSGMVKPMLYDIGFSKTDLGLIVGSWGFVAGLVGALLGGWLTPRLGYYRALLLFIVLQGLAAASYGWVPLGFNSYQQVTALITAEHVISGMHTAAMFTVMMAACRQHSEGTDYTIQACAFVIANGIGISLSGFVADTAGYSLTHWLGGSFALLAFVPIAVAASRGGFVVLRQPQ